MSEGPNTEVRVEVKVRESAKGKMGTKSHARAPGGGECIYITALNSFPWWQYARFGLACLVEWEGSQGTGLPAARKPWLLYNIEKAGIVYHQTSISPWRCPLNQPLRSMFNKGINLTYISKRDQFTYTPTKPITAETLPSPQQVPDRKPAGKRWITRIVQTRGMHDSIIAPSRPSEAQS